MSEACNYRESIKDLDLNSETNFFLKIDIFCLILEEKFDQANLLNALLIETETIQDDSGTFEIRKIIVRNEPTITPYFLDRATLSKDGYLVFFAYNMAIPIEEGDYTITEWTIKKKIEI